MNEPKTTMFEGIKVIDITNNLAGPVTATLMAERGADVIHIEMPGKGDDSRYFPPILTGRNSTAFMWCNRGKRSVTLNLKDPRAIEIIYKMVKDADVFIESNRPGVMDRLGLGYEKLSSLNERLIYCSVSAFGHTGPNSLKPGYDVIAQAYSGIMSYIGEKDGPPTKVGIALGDYVGALNGYGSVVSALYYRERTGLGQHVDVALARGLLWMSGFFNYCVDGSIRGRNGNQDAHISPYGIFNGTDGSCVIGAANQVTWKRLCEVMHREEALDDPRFKTNADRAAHTKEVVELIEGWLHEVGSIDLAVEMVDKAGVPVSKINEGDFMFRDKHALETGWIQNFKTSSGVTEVDSMPGCIGLSELSRVKLDGTKPAPGLGEHNYEVLTEYGMTKEEIDQCLKDWDAK